jgi:hypothetical protein
MVEDCEHRSALRKDRECGDRHLLVLLAVGGVTLLASGCTLGLGPYAVRAERPDYNEQIIRSANSEMLLNVVRLRYDDTPLFLELGAVVSQYSISSALNGSGQVGWPTWTGSASVGGSVAYSESPTITYTPLAGEDFAERMISPISLDAILLLVQTGWNVEHVLLLAMQRINDLYNAPSATGPIPESKPDYEAFEDFTIRFARLHAAHLAGLNWEKQENEKQPPGRDPHFWIHSPADPSSPLAADVEVVRRYLGLQAGRDDFELTGFPFNRGPGQVGMRCRSLLGVLHFLSSSVEPPPTDVANGLVTITRDERGQPYDWSDLSGRLMKIRSSPDRPKSAYVAALYRGYWFYVSDDDRRSKATFGLLNLLFSVQAATSKGKSPILTLPVGGR